MKEPLSDDLREYVEHNMGLVYAIALAWKSQRLKLDDRVQAGTLGLMRAVQMYDPEISTLATYATRWIKSSIRIAEGADTVIRIPPWVLHDHADEKLQRSAEKNRKNADKAFVAGEYRDDMVIREGDAPSLDDAEEAAWVRFNVERLTESHRDILLSLAWDDETLMKVGRRYRRSGEWVRSERNRAYAELRKMMAGDLEYAKGV